MLSALLTLLCAVPAAAEVRPGQVGDPAGDAAAGRPDLTQVALSHDTAGSVTARFTFATAPTDAQALASVQVGQRSFTGTCRTLYAFGALAGGTSTESSWAVGTGGQGQGTRSLDGATLTITATDPALALDADCFTARVALLRTGAADDDATAVADLTLPDRDADGVVDRDDRCAEQAAPGTSDGCPAAPPPTTTTTTPTTTTPSTDPPDPVPPKPTATPLERYDAAVAACPSRKGKARTRCLSTASRRNKAGARLAAKRRTNPFLGRAFFRPDVDVGGVCGGACLAGIVLPDDRWAYRGVPEDGPVLVRCSRTTAVGEEDGCLRYTLSKDRRTATVGGVRYRLAKDRRSVMPSGDNGGSPTAVAIPAVGTAVPAALSSISSFGIPGVNQTFSTSELTLAADGRFVSAGAVTGSTGGGTDFETSFTSIGADRRGTYAFEPGGTLAQFYEDGRVVRRSAFVAFGPGSKPGRIAADGLFLDGSFYGIED